MICPLSKTTAGPALQPPMGAGRAWASWNQTEPGQCGCDRAGASIPAEMEHWSGEVCQLTSRGDPARRLQWCFSGPAAGSADTEASVFLGSQRLLRPAPTQHPSPVQTSPVSQVLACGRCGALLVAANRSVPRWPISYPSRTTAGLSRGAAPPCPQPRPRLLSKKRGYLVQPHAFKPGPRP